MNRLTPPNTNNNNQVQARYKLRPARSNDDDSNAMQVIDCCCQHSLVQLVVE